MTHRNSEAVRNLQQNSENIFSSDSDNSTEESFSSNVVPIEIRDITLAEKIEQQLSYILFKPNLQQKIGIWKNVLGRQYGCKTRMQISVTFSKQYYDSLETIQSMKPLQQLKSQIGLCSAKAISFDPSGNILTFGSSGDSSNITIWDWSKNRKKLEYKSGHSGYVLHCKFLPLSGNYHLVSCSVDGSVRLGQFSECGQQQVTRQLAKHDRGARKLATWSHSPCEILSVGEDGRVFDIDLREDSNKREIFVKNYQERRLLLFGIHAKPFDSYQFCVSAPDNYVRVYDRRNTKNGKPCVTYCPTHLQQNNYATTSTYMVTCSMYNYNGSQLLIAYENEDIYLFDTIKPEYSEPVHRYVGRRSSFLGLGGEISFFSPTSKYIVGGSRCGSLFVWDTNTEAIIDCVPLGKDYDIITAIEPHPHFPILATGGKDMVQIWLPNGQKQSSQTYIDDTIRSNLFHSVYSQQVAEQLKGSSSEEIMEI